VHGCAARDWEVICADRRGGLPAVRAPQSPWSRFAIMTLRAARFYPRTTQYWVQLQNVEGGVPLAHLWIQDETRAWGIFPLEAQLLSLPEALPADGNGRRVGLEPAEAILLWSDSGSGTRWVLMTASDSVRVNGLPLTTGIHVLDDRDEICLGTPQPIYFSTEVPAAVEVFPGFARPVVCPRCTLEIAPGTQAAVRCPNCGVWHHQSEEYPCWTYSPRCALCGQATELGIGFRWSPEEL
jgi:hypothetical protein